MLQRPAIDSCITLPITGYYIHAVVTNANGDVNERVYTSNYIDDMLGGIMGEFSVSYNDTFEQDLYPNANYIFVVKIHNNVSKITRVSARPSCSKYCLRMCVDDYAYVAYVTYTYIFKNKRSNLYQLVRILLYVTSFWKTDQIS